VIFWHNFIKTVSLSIILGREKICIKFLIKLEFGMYPQSMPTEWTHARTVRPWQSEIYDASFSGVCRPKFTKLGTRVEQSCALNKFILELQYSASFGRESKGDRKYAKCRHFLAHRVV